MKNGKVKSEVGEWVKALLIAVVIALAIRLFVFEIARVDGPSMQPTLYTGQRVYVDKLAFLLRMPKRGEIVVCYFDRYTGHGWKDATYIKRVIGLPGETIEIKDAQIYINGKLYDDPYYGGYMPFDIPATKIPSDSVFVMGDNRGDSRDSTDAAVGAIQKKFIIGKAQFRIWPMNLFGKIK